MFENERAVVIETLKQSLWTTVAYGYETPSKEWLEHLWEEYVKMRRERVDLDSDEVYDKVTEPLDRMKELLCHRTIWIGKGQKASQEEVASLKEWLGDEEKAEKKRLDAPYCCMLIPEAVYRLSVPLLRMLVDEYGASVCGTDRLGRTALDNVTSCRMDDEEESQLEVVAWLLHKGGERLRQASKSLWTLEFLVAHHDELQQRLTRLD